MAPPRVRRGSGIRLRGHVRAPRLPYGRVARRRNASTPSGAAWQPLPEFGVAPGQIVVRSPARLGDWFGYLFFFVLWYGALALFRSFGAPLFVLILFGGFGGIFVLFAIDLLLGRTTLTVDRTALRIRRTCLGIGFPRRTIAASEIVRLEQRAGASTGNCAYHAMREVLRDGRGRGVAQNIRMTRDA